MMERAKGVNKHHHKGCLTYKTLKKRYEQQNRQIAKAAKEVYYLQCFKAGIASAPLMERIRFLFNSRYWEVDND